MDIVFPIVGLVFIVCYLVGDIILKRQGRLWRIGTRLSALGLIIVGIWMVIFSR